MTILICILKAIFGYFILMLIGTNLLGMVIRGIVPSYKKDADGNLHLVEDINSRSGIITTIVFSLVGILYFYALYHYWNIGIMIAGWIYRNMLTPPTHFKITTQTGVFWLKRS
jgi:hypothetical protein